MQQSNIKRVSCVCVQISNVLGFNFIDEDAKMSQDGKREKFWKRGINATMTAHFRRQCR